MCSCLNDSKCILIPRKVRVVGSVMQEITCRSTPSFVGLESLAFFYQFIKNNLKINVGEIFVEPLVLHPASVAVQSSVLVISLREVSI